MRNGLGEVLMAPPPVVYDLRTLDAEAVRDLGGVHQIVEINLTAHDTTVLGGCDTDQRSGCVRIDANGIDA